jgi:hypothetical protein
METDKTPYAFRIYRRMGQRKVLWFSDTEYGLDATLKQIADLVGALSHPDTVIAVDVQKVQDTMNVDY